MHNLLLFTLTNILPSNLRSFCLVILLDHTDIFIYRSAFIHNYVIHRVMILSNLLTPFDVGLTMNGVRIMLQIKIRIHVVRHWTLDHILFRFCDLLPSFIHIIRIILEILDRSWTHHVYRLFLISLWVFSGSIDSLIHYLIYKSISAIFINRSSFNNHFLDYLCIFLNPSIHIKELIGKLV